MKVLAYRINQQPQVIEIGKGLKSMQEYVGGYIEHVRLDNGYCLVCNEEGVYTQPLQPEYKIYGNFFIAKDGAEDIKGITLKDAEYVKANIQKLLSIVLRY